MGNTIAWPIMRLVGRVSMILTLCCCLYILYFIIFKSHDNFISQESKAASMKDSALVLSEPVLDLKPYDEAFSGQARDVFSLSDAVGPSGEFENTPKGQLPAHLKVVGILVSNPSQIIIEDTYVNKTYFIDEGQTQAGIKIAKVNKDQMIINYQGQDIALPITKN